ncbi:hypothetical protein C0V77_00960 [Emticicia sp. TH156]|nr:hypothetical protein C0V77_00960 [Emticicia sp. TH156]
MAACFCRLAALKPQSSQTIFTDCKSCTSTQTKSFEYVKLTKSTGLRKPNIYTLFSKSKKAQY